MQRLLWLPTVVVAVILSGTNTSAQAAGWFDNFNNGSIADNDPVTWTFNEIGASPGSYDASSGDLILSAPGDPMPIIPTDESDNSLVPSVDMVFGDTYARTQAITLPDDSLNEARGNAGIVLRWDPITVTGYVALMDHGDQLEVVRIDGGAPTLLDAQENIGINTLTDAVMEVTMVGSELSVFLWRPSDPKPTVPISTVTDNTYATGRAGLFFNEDSDGHFGIFRYATAQDTPIISGDFNRDEKVDAADLVQWQGDFGINGDSDADFDNDSDGADFLQWQRDFGTGATLSISTAVPEPSSFLLLGLAVMLCKLRRWPTGL